MTEEGFKTIDSNIGTFGAIAITVGSVIGLGLFVLPTRLASNAGPSFVLSILVGLIPLSLALLQMVQLGSAIPVAGGTYVYASRLIHPYFGFLTPWVGVPAIWAGLLFSGTGLADYASYYVDVPDIAIVYAVLVPFLVINLLGIRIVAKIQIAMVALIVAGALAFVGPGIAHVDPGNYEPLFPNGIGPFAVGAIAMYPTLQGFVTILQIGEEVENPSKTIPRVLAASAVIGIGLMVAMVGVMLGVRHWTELEGLQAGFAVISESYLPWWATFLIVAAAVMSALTTVNTTYTGLSRSIMRAARDGVLPGPLADVHDEWDTPTKAVLLIGVPPLLIAPLGLDLVSLSILLSLALFLGLFNGSIALWNLPKRYPQRYESSGVRLPRNLLRVVAIGSALSTGLLMLALAGERPLMLGAFLGWALVGFVVYKLRAWQFARRDVDLPVEMSRLHANE